MNRIDIARVCHEVNAAYCLSIGDVTQVPWEAAPEWQQQSALLGVDLHLGNPSASPATSHESWLAEKVRDGWMWGPVKNPDLKQHPCIMRFEDLHEKQQAKDYIFKSVVNALAKHLESAPDAS